MTEAKQRLFMDLASEAGSQLQAQLSRDALLFRAEMKSKASVISSTAAYSGVSCVFLGLGVFMAVQTIFLLLVWLGIAPVLAALSLTVALTAIGAGCLLKVRSLMRNWTVLPERTIAAINADITTLKKAITNVAL